jgi:hypothetical protein
VVHVTGPDITSDPPKGLKTSKHRERSHLWSRSALSCWQGCRTDSPRLRLLGSSDRENERSMSEKYVRGKALSKDN